MIARRRWRINLIALFILCTPAWAQDYAPGTLFTMTSVWVIGSGTGTVSGGGYWPMGTTLQLVPHPSPGSRFDGIVSPSDSGCGLTMVAWVNRNCYARFSISGYAFAVHAAGPGTVTSSLPAGSYAPTTYISMTASTTNTFNGWTCNGVSKGTALTVAITMTQATSCTATFTSLAGVRVRKNTLHRVSYVYGCQTQMQVPGTFVQHTTDEIGFGWCNVSFGDIRLSVGWVQSGVRGANTFLFTEDTRQGPVHTTHLDVQTPATSWFQVALIYDYPTNTWEAWYSLGYQQNLPGAWKMIRRFAPAFSIAQFAEQGVNVTAARDLPLAGAVQYLNELCFGNGMCGGPGGGWRRWDTTVNQGATQYEEAPPYKRECSQPYWSCFTFKY